ncbi:uncharacterized protein CDAR_98361 [Caerostris darwini]|uniref:Uncharacterized protein n=1 Tax=Caerostris darwini TaxID=1538125 RepID=A0AAV4UG83_9ARAC|nr:uncharacterized protein CDAR_98361 [Caerostris darwini]
MDEEISQILLWGPKLISLGLNDTSPALDYIYKTVDSFALNTHQISLKRCYWGKKILWHELWDGSFTCYMSRYSEIIRNAALSCPMLEELIITVRHVDCIQHLRHLKRLDVLCILFRSVSEGDFSAFLALLRDIGHQLRHLSISASQKMPYASFAQIYTLSKLNMV